jgi:hypothetical protein
MNKQATQHDVIDLETLASVTGAASAADGCVAGAMSGALLGIPAMAFGQAWAPVVGAAGGCILGAAVTRLDR